MLHLLYLHTVNLFTLSTFALFLFLLVVIVAAIGAGLLAGRWMNRKSHEHRESVGVVQGALLGLVGLMLAFGLSMAVNRYDGRRELVVAEANDIGTTYLRAQMLDEPQRTESLTLLRDYTDAAIELARVVPGSRDFREARTAMESLHDDLWAAADDAVHTDPEGTVPRLYIESLNDVIDVHAERVASLSNRVPDTVMWLLVLGSAIAVGFVAYYVALIGTRVRASLVALGLVVLILFVTFDLDRPERGFIKVPAAPLVDLRATMQG